MENEELGDVKRDVDEQDEELDALLDDALKDFEKVHIEEKNLQSKQKFADSVPPDPSIESHEEFIHNDDIFQLTNNLTDFLEQIVKDEPVLKAKFDSFQQEIEASTTCAEPQDHQSPFFNMDETMTKTLDDLTKNLEGLGTGDGDDEFEAMFKQMQSEMEYGEGEGDGDGFMHMMKGMMQNLLSKDLLYPSLKEIKEQYPDWLKLNKTKLASDEYDNYVKQESIVCKLCQLFDEDNENDSESVKSTRMSKIVSLMEQMQVYGHPPADMMESIVGAHQEGSVPQPTVPECNLM